jgi:5-methylcytosine-specific restriction endonuclease McrA
MDGQRDFVLEAPRVQRSSCVALRPGRYKLELTASQALHDKIEQLQHLLRHQVPGGDLATIVERAVDLLLATMLKRRFAQKHAERSQPPQASTSLERAEPAGRATSEERATPVEPAGTSKAVAASKDRRKTQSRYVPRAVVREVYARDEGQCTFVSSNARRCSERGTLELHHVIPFGLGGPATVDNLRVVCRAHNALFAERDFGADHIRRKRSQHHSKQQTTMQHPQH